MNALKRVLWWLVATVGGALLLGAVSVVLAVAALGVFRTSGDAWTTELTVAGRGVRVNVPALVRLATLPGIAHLLEGRTLQTNAGAVHFTRDGRTLRATCGGCRVRHPTLASTTITTEVALEAVRAEDVVTGSLRAGEVRVEFAARLRADGIDLDWRLPATELAAVARAFGDAIPEAAFARIEGTVHAKGTVSLPARRGRVRWSAEGLAVDGLGTERLQEGTFRFACQQADGARALATTGDGTGTWAAADAMGAYLAAAVVAAEDQRFGDHAGYDAQAIDAVLNGLAVDAPKRGASTITQQLARTLYTGGEKTAARKLRELLYAIEMEHTLGKARILELYLNTVDWGPGLCGAKAAARAYFNKPPARLTAIEAAWLAGVLRNPHAAWKQQFAARQPDRDRAAHVLMEMRTWPRRERQRMALQPLAFRPESVEERSKGKARQAARAPGKAP